MSSVLLAGERPLARWGVLRRAGVAVEDGRLLVRGRFRTRAWALGPGGVASAAHTRGSVCAAVRGRAKAARFNPSGGCLHLCDAAGASLACLIVSDWLPNGTTPVTLEFPDAFAGPKDDTKRDRFLELSGARGLLEEHGVPVHEVAEQPPPAGAFAGTLRPGPRAAVSVPLLLTTLALLFLGLLAMAVLALLPVERTDAVRNAGYLAATLPVALFVLGNAAFAAVTALSALRGTGPAGAELRPRPGVPVTRAFLARTSLRQVGGNLELRTARNVKRLMRGPEDRVFGVREAVVLEDGGRPWGVALVDRRRTVLAFLHADTWIAGDPGHAELRAFCQETGIALTVQAARAFPAGQVNATDRTARKPGADRVLDGELSAFPGFIPFVGIVFPAFATARGLGGEVEWDPYYVISGIAFACALLPAAVRAGARALWLDRTVTPEAGAHAGKDRRKTAKELHRG